MKIGLSLFILVYLLSAADSNAQNFDDKILLSVAGIKVPAGEFIRMYGKSSEPGNKEDVDEYLHQFEIFKLKIADAISEGIDTTNSFRTELNGYRNQLAQHYLTDNDTKEALLQKAYKRYLTEINAWHILVACPGGSSPEDTLEAWKKAAGIRERIIQGEPFEQVARSTSDDPSVKINGGYLGYFTAFQMIMPFEDAAFNLKTGEISQPVRTPYGYHIIKVTGRRPSRGKILVAHIMKVSPPGTSEEQEKEAEESINKIYRELQAGANFNEMAKKYSDHKESAANGGKLPWFGAGDMIPDFSEAAFNLKDTGDFTKPVRTVYGWHIIKLLDRKPPGTFEEARSYLESKLNRSSLNSLGRNSLVEKLKKEYNFRMDRTLFNWFTDNTDTLIIQGLKRYKIETVPQGNIYSFADQHLSAKAFATFIAGRGAIILTGDPVYFIQQSINASASDQIIKYENSILEKKYPDFRYLINEFHDGMLLFEISSEKVWNKAREDSMGLKSYYENHKLEHITRRSIDAKIYEIRSPTGEKLLYSCYRKFARKAGTDSLMREKINRKGDSLLIIKEGKWHQGDNKDIDGIKWTAGVQFSRINNLPAVIVIKKLYEPVPLSFEEVKGEMMTGYQDYLENEWVKQLKAKYDVMIDNSVLNEVKSYLKNE